MIIAFDFDGVIADTTALKSKLFLEMFKEHESYGLVEQYEKENFYKARSVKLTAIAELIVKSSKTHINNAEEYKVNFLKHYLELYADVLEKNLSHAVMVKGFRSFYERLVRDHQAVYIVSAAPANEIIGYLNAHNLGHIKKIYDYKTEKSQALNEIAHLEKVAAQDVIFFGDNQSDYVAAQKAGTTFVAINSQITNEDLKYKFPDFTYIPQEFFDNIS